MTYRVYHGGLTRERWAAFPMRRRVLHVGAELHRLQRGLARGDGRESRRSVERAIELLDLTVETARPGRQRRELCRAREVLRGILLADDPQREARRLARTLVGDL